MPFDPMKVNGYTVEELKSYIDNGEVTFPQLQQLGLHWQKQESLKTWSEEKQKAAEREQIEWEETCRQNTIAAYRNFINKYPNSSNAIRAEVNIGILESETEQLIISLLDDMKVAPWKYTADLMNMLFNGVGSQQLEILRNAQSDDIDPVVRDFILSGQRLPFEKLLELGIIPEGVSKKDICAQDYTMPQKTVRELGEFPTGRTDVYFLGVPRSGKSSVLSGMMYKLWIDGRAGYEPHFVNGIDPCANYYKGLIKAMASKKPPVGTPNDSISFMKLNIRHPNGKRRNEVTIVEMSGEAFKGIAAGHESEDSKRIWENLGATQCIRVPNRKCMFFVLDYSLIREIDGAYCSSIEQEMMLNDSLRAFCYDGPNKEKPNSGCTMSKVDTVAIIMTKCDLMEGKDTREERLDEAFNYINSHFSTFANNLLEVCKRYGINKANDYLPYILTFSLGHFYVGNTVVFNGDDSEEIINFISTVTRSVDNQRTNFLGF